MKVPSILDLLLNKNKIRLILEEGQLKWRAPPGVVTPDIEALLKQHKNEIMERLRPPEPEAVPSKPFPMGSCRLIGGDCQAALTLMPADFVDCMVTDPPYGLGFMSKAWDKSVPPAEIWKECLRVLKPGAFAYILCSPRQDLLNRMFHNLEEAGFDTRFTSIYWTYASGFAKATNVKKQLTKRTDKPGVAEQFEGTYAGFQPKPAVEVIIVAMRPMGQKSYTAQALSNGKGITRLDDCRIPIIGADGNSDQGRFPANLLVSDAVLDNGKISRGGSFPAKRGETEYFGLNQKRSNRVGPINDQGGYSRYFSLDAWVEKTLPFLIVNKATRKEKEAGLEGFEEKQIMGRDFGQDIRNNPFKIRPAKRRNVHPTVKPIELMSYLIAMGSREGDIILDPFSGSGTTNIAALMLNRKTIGIEIDEHYHQIACARVRDCFIHNPLN